MLEVNGSMVGFIVDSATETLRLRKVPLNLSNIAGLKAHYLAGVASSIAC